MHFDWNMYFVTEIQICKSKLESIGLFVQTLSRYLSQAMYLSLFLIEFRNVMTILKLEHIFIFLIPMQA